MALRWTIDNGWPCHRACHDDVQHLAKYERTLLGMYGEDFVEGLKWKGKQYQKAPTDAELTEIIERLTFKLTVYANKKSIG